MSAILQVNHFHHQQRGKRVQGNQIAAVACLIKTLTCTVGMTLIAVISHACISHLHLYAGFGPPSSLLLTISQEPTTQAAAQP